MDGAAFGRAVRDAAAREDGAQLARLLDVRGSALQQCCARGGAARAAHGAPAPWSDICAAYLAAGERLYAAGGARDAPTADAWHEACEALERALGAFLRYFGSLAPGRWALPALYALLRGTRWVAQRADAAARDAAVRDAAVATGHDGRAAAHTLLVSSHREEYARQLNKAFSACIADRFPALPQSKKWGTYVVVNLLFHIYFELKTTALCKNVLRALDAADLPGCEAFPRAERVTFAYYVGRLAFLDEAYTKAEQHLAAALAEAPKNATHNCERILLYLVAVRLLHGVRPSAWLLAPYPRLAALYAPILSAYGTGDVRAYDVALAAPNWEPMLVRLGLYLALERARDVCITRLFRRVWAVSGHGTRLRLALFSTALRWCGLKLADAETEWALATLIAQGRVKGYIAHERQMLVLSATDPFPRASLTMLA